MNAITSAPGRPGRGHVTTHSQLSQIALKLFIERGFDETTVDEIAREAGISRRTLFRYFPTKNDLPWGDFDSLLDHMRATLSEADQELSIFAVLRKAVIEFNRFPQDELAMHRSRMWLLLNVPTLMAHSTLRYTEWRKVIAEFVAHRLGVLPSDLTPQTIAGACLGISLAAYEQWLAHDDANLMDTFDVAFSSAEEIFGAKTLSLPGFSHT
jgi:mycofactocin system transcriptional regulator